MRAVVHLLYGPHHTDFSLLFGIDSKPTWSWLNRWLCIWEATEELEISTSNTLTCFYTPTYWRFCRCQTRPWRRGRRSWLWPSCASCWGAAGAGACAVAWRAAWRQPGCRTCLASNAFSTATSSSSPTTEHDRSFFVELCISLCMYEREFFYTDHYILWSPMSSYYFSTNVHKKKEKALNQMETVHLMWQVPLLRIQLYSRLLKQGVRI